MIRDLDCTVRLGPDIFALGLQELGGTSKDLVVDVESGNASLGSADFDSDDRAGRTDSLLVSV